MSVALTAPPPRHCIYVPRGTSLRAHLDAVLDKSGGPDACWPHTGALTRGGYALMQHAKERDTVHRWAWREDHGTDVPAGKMVRHTCDNPPCGNGRHLKLGTGVDNMQDMYSRGRAPDQRGEKHGSAKLTAAIVTSIRARVAAGETQRAMQDEFSISQSHMSGIIHRRYWKDTE